MQIIFNPARTVESNTKALKVIVLIQIDESIISRSETGRRALLCTQNIEIEINLFFCQWRGKLFG